MPKTKYKYTGPNSAATLSVSDGAGGFKDQDVILWNGQTVVMPSDHDVTKTLIHQGFLEPVGLEPISPVLGLDAVSLVDKPITTKAK